MVFAVEALLLGFVCLLLLRWVRGEREIACGCFGAGDLPTPVELLLLRTVALTGAAAVPWIVGSFEGRPGTEQILPALVISTTAVVAFNLGESAFLALRWLDRAPSELKS